MHWSTLPLRLMVTTCLLVSACSTGSFTPPPQSTVQTSRPAAPLDWSGGQAQIAVAAFEDLTYGVPQSRRNLLGRGMEAQLVSALRETGRFAILEPQEKVVQNRRGEFFTTQVGSHEEPEFFVTGSVLAYRISPASVAAGPAADPLLSTANISRGGAWTSVAEQVFSNLSNSPSDQVEIALSLFDGRTGTLIDETRITAAPQDLSSALPGMFSAELLRTDVASDPPTQRAVRASVIKATNWIADHCSRYRREQASNPNPDDPPLPLAKENEPSNG